MWADTEFKGNVSKGGSQEIADASSKGSLESARRCQQSFTQRFKSDAVQVDLQICQVFCSEY